MAHNIQVLDDERKRHRRDDVWSGDDCRMQPSSTPHDVTGRHWGYQWTPVVALNAKQEEEDEEEEEEHELSRQV